MARPLFLTALALGTALAATQAVAQPASYVGAGDRYGPSGAAAPTLALRGRVLAWPGKVARPVAAQVAIMPSPVAGPAYGWRDPAAAGPGGGPMARQVYPRAAPAAAAPTAYATNAPRTWRPAPQAPQAYPVAQPASLTRPAASPALAGAPSDGWRPVFPDRPAAAAARPTPQAAPPTSIYAPAGPGYSPTLAAVRAPPPNRAMAADRRYGYDPTQDHSVRLYSVARPFGLRPDPAPIPPQFFTATADLGGEPPGPLPINHTTATTRAAVAGGDGASQ